MRNLAMHIHEKEAGLSNGIQASNTNGEHDIK